MFKAVSQFPGHASPAEGSVLCYIAGIVPKGWAGACCGVLCDSMVPALAKERLIRAGKDQHCALYCGEGKKDIHRDTDT